MSTNILDFLAERVLVIDGAMGTQIQGSDLTLEDFAGHENCSEVLNETRPDFVRGVHDAYLEAGAMAVETNTFGANKIVLAEFGLEGKTRELNASGARLAHEACERYATPSEPRFVIGSVGPGTKLPTLGHTDYDTLVDSYAEQVRGLLDGGIDAVLIETCQDILQTKAAIAAANRAFRDLGRRVPIFCQVTMETTGTMLVGTDIAAALTAIEPFSEVSVFGLNCATGPQEMSEYVAYLGKYSPKPVSVVPNAGLPQLVDGRTHYPLTPRELASWLVRFIEDDGVAIVGGCCGTTPEHIREVAKAVGKRSPGRRSPAFVPSLSSLYSAVPVVQDASYLIIGERTNVLGSRKFKDAFTAGDMDGMVAVAKAEVREGCHLIDVCADQTGRDARADLIPILKAMATQVPVPICVDSNSWTTFEPALKLLGGRSLVNSLNLENGEEDLVRYLEVARSFGAAVILGTIDEDKEAGMAKTAERKVAVARRLFEIATRRCGLRPHDIFFDPLVLPISTGQEEARRNALETIEGIRRIKAEVPGTFTTVGLSNVSFGLKPAARHVLNSVFLHYCREAGLDAAIVHASKIVPLYRIDPRERELAEDLVFDRRRPGYDPLTELMSAFGGRRSAAAEKEARPASVEERLKKRIIDGDRVGLEEDLATALERYAPLDIINVFLLDGMKVVGELFGSGQMQLPFVLQSAETMKAAVSWLEPHMEKVEGESKGRIVLATVKGDVHDIGKNLVDIILSNNGYTVHNLGIKQPITSILEEARRREAHAVGLSGLLVKSTVVMKENLEEMERQGVCLPVLLGGAALTRRYVEIDCRRAYTGRVEYGKDAFEALSLMASVMGAEEERPSRYAGGRGYVARTGAAEGEAAGEEAGGAPAAVATAPSPEPAGAAPGERDAPAIPSRFERPVEEALEAALPARSEVRRDIPVPRAPFLGARVIERIALDAVLPYLNENVLFKFQWQFKQKKMAKEEYERFIDREVRPILRDLVRRCKEERILEPRAVYGYFECHGDGDDVVVYRPGTSDVLHRFRFPRQKKHKRLCIADFFRPAGTPTILPGAPTILPGAPTILPGAPTILPGAPTILPGAPTILPGAPTILPGAPTILPGAGEKDIIAFTVVTVGARASEVERRWFAEHRYRDYLYLHGLSVESAEALAELIHRQVRVELEITGDDSREIAGLFRQGYRGSRYSFGYPACPRLEDQAPLLEILGAERIGVTLSEEFMLEPEQSTSALIVHHPQAKYFNA